MPELLAPFEVLRAPAAQYLALAQHFATRPRGGEHVRGGEEQLGLLRVILRKGADLRQVHGRFTVSCRMIFTRGFVGASDAPGVDTDVLGGDSPHGPTAVIR